MATIDVKKILNNAINDILEEGAPSDSVTVGTRTPTYIDKDLEKAKQIIADERLTGVDPKAMARQLADVRRKKEETTSGTANAVEFYGTQQRRRGQKEGKEEGFKKGLGIGGSGGAAAALAAGAGALAIRKWLKKKKAEKAAKAKKSQKKAA